MHNELVRRAGGVLVGPFGINAWQRCSSRATVNQHPSVQHEGWMNGNWSGKQFSVGLQFPN